MKQAFDYIRPLWENRYGQVSVRAVLAIVLTINFMFIITKASSDAIFTEAGLITALLGLTAFQNISDKKTEIDLKKTIVASGKTDTSTLDDNDVSVTTVK